MHSGGASVESVRTSGGTITTPGAGARGAARCAECGSVPRWVLKLLHNARRDRLTGSIDLSLKDGVPSNAKRIIEFLDPSKIG